MRGLPRVCTRLDVGERSRASVGQLGKVTALIPAALVVLRHSVWRLSGCDGIAREVGWIVGVHWHGNEGVGPYALRMTRARVEGDRCRKVRFRSLAKIVNVFRTAVS